MAEYIEREALLEEINEKISNIAFTSPYQREVEAIVIGMERARDSVEDVPATDVAPVVHGEWKPYRDYFSKRHIGWICTNCSGVQMDLSNGDTNYCPNCGAMMNLEE